MYDVIIIGGGPAGLTAGIYASRAGKKALLIERYGIGGQIALSHEIENYAGAKPMPGMELTQIMYEQAERFGTEFVFDKIIGMDITGEVKEIKTEYSGDFQAKKVILAMGSRAKHLGLKREAELIGSGVSYCATCDGNFFRGKSVAVIGGGDTALTDAIYLSKIAKKVYIIHRRDEYRGSKILVDAMRAAGVEEVLNAKVTALNGMPLESIDVQTETGTRNIQIEGLFIAIGAMPQTQAIKDIVALDEYGYIITDELMKTNVEGVYAAGDIIKKPLRQVITACADGAIAGSQI